MSDSDRKLPISLHYVWCMSLQFHYHCSVNASIMYCLPLLTQRVFCIMLMSLHDCHLDNHSYWATWHFCIVLLPSVLLRLPTLVLSTCLHPVLYCPQVPLVVWAMGLHLTYMRQLTSVVHLRFCRLKPRLTEATHLYFKKWHQLPDRVALILSRRLCMSLGNR